MNLGNHRTARRALAGLTVAAALALPAQASAAGAGVSFGVLGIGSGSDAANITVTQQGANLVVADSTQRLDAMGGCSNMGTPAKVVCSAAGVRSIAAVLGDGNDRFDSKAVALPANVTGGNGDDRITAGTGADVMNGNAGNDVFSARDGAPDSITCGSGADSGQVDAGDTLSNDCESAVERPSVLASGPLTGEPPQPDPTGDAPATDQPAGDGATGAGAGADGGAALDAPLVISVPPTLVLSRLGDITIRVGCTADSGVCRGTIELIESNGTLKARTVTTARRRKAARKGALLGRKSFAVRAGQEKSVRIRLARNGRQRIIKRKKRKTKAKLVITMRTPDGGEVTTEKNVTIAPPRERRTSNRGGKRRSRQ